MFDHRIIFITKFKNELICYKNLDYARLIDNLRFIGSFVVLLIIKVLSHKSKFQNIVTLSSYKVEYYNHNESRKRCITYYLI